MGSNKLNKHVRYNVLINVDENSLHSVHTVLRKSSQRRKKEKEKKEKAKAKCVERRLVCIYTGTRAVRETYRHAVNE